MNNAKHIFKSAGEALAGAFRANLNGTIYCSQWEEIAQAFLASEWGESDPFCSECARSGHSTTDCPFPAKHIPLFPDL